MNLENVSKWTTPWEHWEVTNFFDNECLECFNIIPDEYYDLSVVMDVERAALRLTRKNCDEFPSLEKIVKFFKRSSTVKYFEEKSNLSLKNTYVRVDLTRDHPGYSLQPHLDRRGKQVTIQIFLGENNFGTELYDEELNCIKTVPFKHNCGYFFFSKAEHGETYWHGLTQKVTNIRDSVIINYISDNEDPILGDMVPDDVDVGAMHSSPPGEALPKNYDMLNPAAVGVNSVYNVPLAAKAFDVEDWWHV